MKTAEFLLEKMVDCLPAHGLVEKLKEKKSLRVKLGLNPEAKFTSELLSISRKKLCVEADKSIKGRQNLFLC